VSYNALPGQDMQKSFAQWAKMQYSDAWAQLKAQGHKTNADDLGQFKINRNLES